MNKAILIGRLTRKPDVRDTYETKVARFTIAVDRRFKKGEADFISCVAFGKAAEFTDKYLLQGTKVVVEGRIQTGSYTKQNGEKVYTTDVIVENLEFAESKASGEASHIESVKKDFVPADTFDDDNLPFS